jgi:hypothetical protein
MAIKDTIFDAPKNAVIEPIATPEWPAVDGQVFVMTMSARARDAWEAAIIADPDKRNYDNIRARLAVLCTCDKDGALLFGMDDADRLGDESALVLDRIWELGRTLAGMDKNEDDEDLSKNSSETTDGASPTS